MKAARRRLLLAGLGVAGHAVGGAVWGAQETGPSPAREALLRDGEAALAGGNTAVALDAFERAAAMQHAADTEMGVVRAHLQAGQYRRALAFCAHVAGAHLDHPAAAGLYAWLLRMGGQPAPAQRVLAQALGRAPDEAVLRAVQAAFATTAEPAASGLLLDPPHRMAPYAVMLDGQAAPPVQARTAGSGVLIDGGRRALVPAAMVSRASRVWLRNGLGQTTQAQPDAQAGALAELMVLRLATPLDPGPVRLAAGRAPFAGTPGLSAQYAPGPSAGAAWPWLRLGFLGGLEAASGQRRLGIDVAAGALGGPVFSVDGALAGLALRGADGEARFVPAAAWSEGGAMPAASAAPPRPALPQPLDEAYEGALRVALQVLVADA